MANRVVGSPGPLTEILAAGAEEFWLRAVEPWTGPRASPQRGVNGLAPLGFFPEHRARAAEIERFCGPGRKRILELGAGAGGTAAAMADLGHEVVAIEVQSRARGFCPRTGRSGPHNPDGAGGGL